MKYQTFQTKILEKKCLTPQESSNKAFFLILKPLSDISYNVGDSIAIYPKNDPKEVEKIIKLLKVEKDTLIKHQKNDASITIFDFLLSSNLSLITTSLLKKLNLSHEYKNLHLIELLEIKKNNFSYIDIVKSLLPLTPRFYSIASSKLIFPNELHILIKYISYKKNNHLHIGISSHYLCDLATEKTSLTCYILKAKNFTLPNDPNKNIIMIGPGMGIAPFIAFLQERQHKKEKGKNWLFLGERNQAFNFYFKDFLLSLEKEELLLLDTAFSRDQEKKIYVQDKIKEKKKDFISWLNDGAYIYICGEAKNMAIDVEKTILDILESENFLTEKEAKDYLDKLKKENRYLKDVY